MRNSNLNLKIISLSIWYVFLIAKPVKSQLTPDNTLGSDNSLVQTEINSEIDNIRGGVTRGSNLFHSFREFNVGRGRVVNFVHSAEVSNILTRVTGGSSSEILGTLSVSGNANLYLINPNGIFFGPDAKLDLKGSFIGSTADEIGLGSKDVFSAVDPGRSKLLSVEPGALFTNAIRQNKRTIINRANLAVNSGKNLTLSADIIESSGAIAAPGGKIFLEAIDGDLNVTNVDTSNLNGGGGNIDLSATKNINIAGKIDASGGIFAVRITNFNDFGFLQVLSNTINNSGNVTLAAGKNIIFRPNSDLFANGLLGGKITLQAREDIFVKRSRIVSGTFSNETRKKGGDMEVSARSLYITDGVNSKLEVSTLGSADAGNLTINTRDSIVAIGDRDPLPTGIASLVYPNASGNGGNVTIQTNLLRLENGTQISISSLGKGNGGLLTIKARQIELIGSGPIIASGLFSSVHLQDGDGGRIDINTNKLTIADGAIIGSSNFYVPEIDPLLPGNGTVGNIEISAREITLDRGRITASVNKKGGGDITINSSRFLLLRNQSEISTDAGETVDFSGGNIVINTPLIIAYPTDNKITAKAKSSRGGTIDITTNALFGYPQFLTIDATSELGIDGTVNLNVFSNDIETAAIELSKTPIDVENIIANDICAVKNDRIAGGSSFTIIGKGGIAPNPRESLDENKNLVEWSKPKNRSNIKRANSFIKEKISQEKPVRSAVGWWRKNDGTVVLTANPAEVRPLNEVFSHPNCQTIELGKKLLVDR